MEEKYFTLVEGSDTSSKNLPYQCLLCLPRKNVISSAVSSNSNLIKHIERAHPSEIIQFKKVLESRSKRKVGTDSE
jgi:hypothetical protein